MGIGQVGDQQVELVQHFLEIHPFAQARVLRATVILIDRVPTISVQVGNGIVS